MLRLRRCPYGTVIAGIVLVLVNLGLAGFNWYRGRPVLVAVGVLSAGIVTYTTIQLLRSWRDLDRAQRRLLGLLIERKLDERNRD